MTRCPSSQEMYSRKEKLTLENSSVPSLIAFYLTQFHPTPENDLWWGKGFTEWTNVTKAKPLFEGHLQPHLPGDFGFYDLRVRETRRHQIEVAKQYGIDGFCYHYYWFSGKRILNLPLDDMLADPESDMPFCLCWANENWTRRWDAAEHEVLIAQEYLPDDDLNFIKSLVPFLQDRRYIKLHGLPFFIVYRPQHLPDARKTVEVWRDYCRLIGLGEIHVCAAFTHGNKNYTQFGFDSGVEFPPHNLSFHRTCDRLSMTNHFRGTIIQFEQVAQSYLDRTYRDSRVFKTVFPSWDNTARRNDHGIVVLNGVPENYEYWLASTIDAVTRSGSNDEFIFINAWNEWAEGCHLEPDRWFGLKFLQATLDVKNGIRRYVRFPEVGLPRTSRSFLRDFSNILGHQVWLRLVDVRLLLDRVPVLRKMLMPTIRKAIDALKRC